MIVVCSQDASLLRTLETKNTARFLSYLWSRRRIQDSDDAVIYLFSYRSEDPTNARKFCSSCFLHFVIGVSSLLAGRQGDDVSEREITKKETNFALV